MFAGCCCNAGLLERQGSVPHTFLDRFRAVVGLPSGGSLLVSLVYRLVAWLWCAWSCYRHRHICLHSLHTFGESSASDAGLKQRESSTDGVCQQPCIESPL